MDDKGVAPNGVGEDPSTAGLIYIIPAVDIRDLARYPIGGHEIDNRLGDVGTDSWSTCQISLHHFWFFVQQLLRARVKDQARANGIHGNFWNLILQMITLFS